MALMFNHAHAFNGELSGWDTSAATSMYAVFYNADAFNGDISGWDTSAVTTMRHMFNYAYAFNADITEWHTCAVTTMQRMFYNCPLSTSDSAAEPTSIEPCCRPTAKQKNTRDKRT